MCNVGYLCANFSFPRPLCFRLRSDVRNRQTDRRQTSDVRRASSLNALMGGGIIIQMKKALRETQTLRAGCSKAEPKMLPRRRPLPGGAGRPKFNQLQMVTTFT